MLRGTKIALLLLVVLAVLLPGSQAFSASKITNQLFTKPSGVAPQGSRDTIPESLQEAVSLDDDVPYVQNQLLVQFAPNTSEEKKAEIHERLGAEVISEIPALGIQILQVTEEATNMVFAYQTESAVTFAEPNYTATITGWPDGPVLSANALTGGEGLSLQPDDPLYPNMWNLAKIRAPQAWDITVGSPTVTVAVIDTGVDVGHPDLQGKITAGYDFVNGDSDPADDQGHGTHVAGTAAAVTDNGIGMAGVAWEVKIMPIKSLSSSGSGAHSWIADGIVWATDHGADVINLSLGGPYTSTTMQQAVKYAWDHGVVIVSAAGNDNTSNPTYPAAYQHVIGVAATTQNDQKAEFSNYGNYISIASPGVSIIGTTRGGRYQAWSGTSMATPQVSALAALLKSVHLGWTNGQIRGVVEETAADLGASGWDSVFGWGRIDAFAALNGAPTAPTASPTLAPTATPRATTPPNDLEQQVIDLINARRAELNLPTLRRDERLMEAARRHSRDMANTGRCDHTGSDGSSPFDRIRDAGYPMYSAGEVIACGYRDPEDVVQAWQNSSSHWSILTNESFVDIGCGVGETSNGTRYWTCDPARPTGGGGVTPTPTNVAPTATPVPPTRTATSVPTNTPTPTPAPTDPANSVTVYITPEAQNVGWVVSNESSSNHFGDDDIYVGIHSGRVYIGAVQFDLSVVPADAKINWGRLTFTGQTRDYVGASGSWSVSLLTSDIDPNWENHGYLQIRDAPKEHLLLPILGNADLQRDTQNNFNLTSEVLRALESRRDATARASFSLDGPSSGSDNLFSWDSGYGVGGLGKPPMLTINYSPGEGDNDTPTPPPPTATPSPTPDTGQPPVTPEVVELTPPADSVGWVASNQPNANNFGDDDLYVGIYSATTYLSGMRFDLSSLPSNIEVLEAELLLTGQSRQYLGSGGTWQVEMLAGGIDAGWPTHGYTDINNATSVGTLQDLSDNDFTLEPGQLDVGKVNRLGLPAALRTELRARRQGTGYVSLRIVGPVTGQSNVFSWDTGYGTGGLQKPPVLKIKYHRADGPGPAPSPTPTATPTLPAGDSDPYALIRAINNERASRGLSALNANDQLMEAAQVHSDDLATNDLWSHTGSDSSTPQDRMRRAGYPLAEGDEVLAANSTDVDAIVDTWLGSSRHADIILNPDYVDIGAGHAYDANSTYGDYWTVVVARPTEAGGTPGEFEIQITPVESAVGWVVSDTPNGNHFGDDDMYVGFYNGLTYVSAVQFDLSKIPTDAQITGAKLTLTGQSAQYLAGSGTWTVQMLDASIDAGWAGHGFNTIVNASSVGNAGNSMSGSDLGAGQTNVLTFSSTLLGQLDSRLHGTGLASFRIVGPNAGQNDVFSWDSGHGSGGLKAPPTLTITYTRTTSTS